MALQEQRNDRPRLVVVDDDDDFLEALSSSLSELGFTVATARGAADALRLLEAQPFELVLTDIRMPERDGISLCKQILGEHPGLPVLVMTAYGDMESALAALRAGATDYIAKPFSLQSLAEAVQRTLRDSPEHPRPRRLQATAVRDDDETLIGSSRPMQELRRTIATVAATDATVLICGESGTGKELVARAIHRQSPRRQRPFLAINCAAMPEGLLESELFGHVRGAFTGADNARSGLLLDAAGGTLLLDEIAAMPLHLQPKLLRALEERVVRHVGASGELPFDTRIIAATNRDLRLSAQQGTFREDLMFRLAVVRIDVPPLRERGQDIVQLANHFLARHGESYQLSAEVIQRLESYAWPGNVRELENCVEAAFALSGGGRIGFEDLPTFVRAPGPRMGHGLSLDDLERRHVISVLDSLGGNKSSAARVLGINRATLYRKLKRWQYGKD